MRARCHTGERITSVCACAFVLDGFCVGEAEFSSPLQRLGFREETRADGVRLEL